MKKIVLWSALLLGSCVALAANSKGLVRPDQQAVEVYGFVSTSDSFIAVETNHEVYNVDAKIFLKTNKVDKDSGRRQHLVRFPASAIIRVVRLQKRGEK